MQRSRRLTYLLWMTLVLLPACISEYDLGNVYDHQGDLTVSGWLTDEAGRQEIELTLSASLQLQIPTPLELCMVQVEDDQGNTFVYNEVPDGKYVYDYAEGDIVPGRAYRVLIVTPEGKTYASEYEKMLLSPEAGDLYYEMTEQEGIEPGSSVPGLQFYTDFEAGDEYGKYFRMEVRETYEFHTAYQEIYWMLNGVFDELPWDSLRPVCYLSEQNPGIYLISGEFLSQSYIEGFPLHFVSNETQKLQNGYSPEIRIIALSEAAYDYWHSQKQILEESGGLFESQPPVVQGNLYCVDDPDEKVLGYFGASQVRSNRTYVPAGVLDHYVIPPYCTPGVLPSYYMQRLQRMGEGVYYFTYYPDAMTGAMVLHSVTKACFDCTAFPYSTTIKPDYWED